MKPYLFNWRTTRLNISDHLTLVYQEGDAGADLENKEGHFVSIAITDIDRLIEVLQELKKELENVK